MFLKCSVENFIDVILSEAKNLKFSCARDSSLHFIPFRMTILRCFQQSIPETFNFHCRMHPLRDNLASLGGGITVTLVGDEVGLAYEAGRHTVIIGPYFVLLGLGPVNSGK